MVGTFAKFADIMVIYIKCLIFFLDAGPVPEGGYVPLI